MQAFTTITLLLALAATGALPAAQLQAKENPAFVIKHMDVYKDNSTGRLIRKMSQKKNIPVQTANSPSPGSGNKVVQGLNLDRLVQEVGIRHDVNPELIHAMIRQESNGNPFAVSVKGAMGLMQLLPATAERFGVKDIFDPAENILGGVKYLRYLMNRYPRQIALVLAGYHAGEGAVDRYGGVPPYPETRAYIASTLRGYESSGLGTLSAWNNPSQSRILATRTPEGGLLLKTH